MARILGGGVFGEMRGKLGSMVFARNRGGAYARQFAKPIDPATVAQLTARNNFGNAASNYHSLTPAEKTNWQNFANQTFNPKSGTMGVSSGFNAFVSLLNVVNNSKLLTTSMEIDSTPVVGLNTLPLIFNAKPPAQALQSNIVTSTNDSYPLNFVSFGNTTFSKGSDTFTVDMYINLKVGGLNFPAGNFGKFEDAEGNTYGFKIFMSNVIDQPGMFVQNPYLIDLGCTEILDWTPGAVGNGEIELNVTRNLTASEYSALPVGPGNALFTLFAVSKSGMLLRLGSEHKFFSVTP